MRATRLPLCRVGPSPRERPRRWPSRCVCAAGLRASPRRNNKLKYQDNTSFPRICTESHTCQKRVAKQVGLGRWQAMCPQAPALASGTGKWKERVVANVKGLLLNRLLLILLLPRWALSPSEAALLDPLRWLCRGLGSFAHKGLPHKNPVAYNNRVRKSRSTKHISRKSLLLGLVPLRTASRFQNAPYCDLLNY